MSLKMLGVIAVLIMIFVYAFGQFVHDGMEKNLCENGRYESSFNSMDECRCIVDKMHDYLGGNLGVGFKMVKQFFVNEEKEADLKNMPIDFFKQECKL